ncbi:MAG: Xaa-Pro dipeptidase [Gammaproteobacteria bacterium]|nr:Xaa-Pro dipeptidase [Gammaproteobacteria bacterium]
MTEAEALYPAHVAEMTRRYAEAADQGGFDALVIGSGVPEYHFQDDQAVPFVANPFFRQWVPLLEHPGSSLVFEIGRRPVLVVLQPADYWHQPPALPAAAIAGQFDLRVIGDAGAIDAHLPGPARRTAILGPPRQWDGLLPAAPRNPAAVVDHLHYTRACKTDWEVACIRAAAAIAAPGHHAALAAFRAGASEYDILAAFLGGCRQTEAELPYGAIVALNEHAATLHYQHRDRSARRPRDLHSLLIDAGCASRGYACDITRSYAFRDDEFAAMVADMDRMQQDLCAAVRPGLPFPDLHRQTHVMLAGLLQRWGLVRMEPADMIAAEITFAFFPHGLGHLLGLQVHDVGGHLADAAGTALQPPADFPRLRFLRSLEPGQVVTIEPGIYFIDSLLERLRADPAGAQVDWGRVEGLRRYGGIRIEDDVLVTATGGENLTRPLIGH